MSLMDTMFLGFNYGYRRAPQTIADNASGVTPAGALHPLPSSGPSAAAVLASAPARPPSQQGGAKPHPNGTPSSTPAPPAAAKSPAPSKPSAPAKSPAQIVNGVNGSTISAASPKSPAVEVSAPATRTTSSPAPSGDRPDHKPKKLSNAEKREKKAAKAAANASASEAENSVKPGSPAPAANAGKHGKKGSKASGRGSPASVSSPVPSAAPMPIPARQESNRPVTSPLTGTESGGDLRSPPARTNSAFGGQKRNPWTLYLSRLPVPVTEEEVKDLFGDTKVSVGGLLYPVRLKLTSCTKLPRLRLSRFQASGVGRIGRRSPLRLSSSRMKRA